MLRFWASFAALTCLTCSAQLVSTTTLTGTVTDSSGGPMAKVTIAATHQGTGDRYSSETSAEGIYTIPFVKTGTYTVVASAAGFAQVTQTGVAVEGNRSSRADFTLKPGPVVESVEIVAQAAPLATDDGTISETLSMRSTLELPLNGRNALRLAAYTPGVLPGFKSPAGNPGGGEGVIAAGVREIQNNISLDGVSIMNNLTSQVTLRPSIDAIEEVQIHTGTYGAQYGGYLGLQMNMSTRSGTNQFHGAVFEFVRNNYFDARGFFQRKPTPQAPFRQNQFGFVLSGPVEIPKLYHGRNRTFFMANYEGLRQAQRTAQLDTVLTPAMRAGDFSAVSKPVTDPRQPGNPVFTGNLIPAGLIAPQSLKLLQYMPLPTQAGIASNYLASVVNQNNTGETIGRIDQTLGDNARLFFRYAWMNTALVNGSTNPSNGYNQPVKNRNFVFAYTQTLSPRALNDFRLGRQSSSIISENFFHTSSLANAGSNLGIPGFTTDLANSGLPDFEIAGFMAIGGQNMSSSNWYQYDTTWHAADSFSYIRGSHSLSVGVEVRRLLTQRTANNNPRGQFNFSGTISGNAAADFMLGLPLSVVTPGPLVPGGVVMYRNGLFASDRWQITPRLTLTAGLRYDIPTVPMSSNGNGTILDPQQTHFIPEQVPAKIPYIQPVRTNIAPRSGFAYRAWRGWVVRGGYGIYYNPNHTNTYTLATTNPPFSTIFTYNSDPTNPLLSLANPAPGSALGAAPKPNAFTIHPNLKTATMNQWSFGLSRSPWKNAGFELEYLGSRSVHLDRSYYNNTPMPGPGNIDLRRPNQLFRVIRTITNDEVATYHGFNAVLRQTYHHGLSALVSYTWSHALDVSSDSNNGGAPMNPYMWWADYGNSNWDVRHRLTGSFVYDMPFARHSQSLAGRVFGNWQLNGGFTAQTGVPFNITVPGDPANTSAGNQRPNLVGVPNSNCGQGHLTACVGLGSFALPSAYTYGNAGRNLMRGPDLATLDLSLFKRIPFHERARLEIRGESFNILNHPNFANPSAVFNTASFGNVTATSTNNRQIQLAAKLVF